MGKGIQPFSEEEEKKIVRECVKAANDITQLSEKAYKFLYLASSFIAHYDRHGFMFEYREPGSLKADILRHQRDNQWGNFRPGEENYDYYMQKKRIYNTVCDCLKQGIGYKQGRKREKEVELDFGR